MLYRRELIDLKTEEGKWITELAKECLGMKPDKESKDTKTDHDKGVGSSSLLSDNELGLVRKWFEALQNLAPSLLKNEDYILGRKIINEHGARFLKGT